MAVRATGCTEEGTSAPRGPHESGPRGAACQAVRPGTGA